MSKKTSSSVLKKAFMTGFLVLSLGGCDWLSDWPPADVPSFRSGGDVRPPPPQMKITQTADATWMQPAPQSKPEEILVPRTETSGGNTPERLEKLEKSVEDMRHDMSMMIPALTRLAEAQADTQALLAQQSQPQAGGGDASSLEFPVQAATPGAPVEISTSLSSENVSERDNVADMRIASLPQAASSGTVRQLRFGEHPDKTRIVLDTSDNVAFRYDLDNKEHILVIELPGMGWGTVAQTSVQNSMLVQSYQASSDGQGGTRLAIQLKEDAQVMWAQPIPSVGGKDPRIVIDIVGVSR